MKKFDRVSAVFLAAVFVFGLAGSVSAATQVNLFTAYSYAILAGSTITNTGSSVITGDLGLHPGSSVTGFPPGTVSGTQHKADAAALQAKSDLATAYDAAAGQSCTQNLTGQDLGGKTLTTGTYCFDSSAGLTGTLTLDAQGDPDAVFIFKIVSTLTTTGGSTVRLTNSAQSCHVFWQVGSSATLGTESDFVGTIMASESVTVTTGASVDGRVLARSSAVTLDTNAVSVSTCAASMGTLHVIKKVTNDNGGTSTASDFNLHVRLSGTTTGGSTAVGAVSPGTSYSLSPATYVVSEDADAAYTQSFSGDCSSTGSVTLAAGGDKTCTITNNDIGSSPTTTTGTLHVIKKVTNDDGGSATASDFSLHVKLSGNDVSGSPADGADSPGTAYPLSAGTYAVSENSFPSYVQSFSGDCNSRGSITLAAGEEKTCTITNNDTGPTPSNPATLHVIKKVTNDDGGDATASDFNLYVKLSGNDVSGSPAAGEASPGTAYLLAAGTYAISEDKDDSYAKSFSGDCNSRGSVTLAEGEEKTCTITNNDIEEESGNHVGIKVTKEASSSALHSGPGSVTFTYKVTNDGDVSLKNVSVKDDMCSPVVYVSGRKDKDGRLDKDEKWKYSCTKIVSATETNKVTAKGTANGERVHDHAKATVTVSSVPGLPNAGIGPEDGDNAPWNIDIPAGIFSAPFSFDLNLKKLAI